MPVSPNTSPLIAALWRRSGHDAARAAVLVAAGVALLTLSAKLKVPFYPVPMTMQTLVVLVLGAAYGFPLGALRIAPAPCPIPPAVVVRLMLPLLTVMPLLMST